MNNINLIAPINQLGYGVAGLNILKSLKTQCDVVSLFPIGQPQVTNGEDAQAVSESIEHAHFFDPDAPCIKIWHQNDMAQFVGRGDHIGFPIFELDTFNELETHHLRSVDRLFVTSEWAKSVTKSIGVPVDVIPLGVDADLFKTCEPSKKEKTIFFNCGKWEVRKGHDILISAFKRLAEKHLDVELWMMCENPFNSQEEESKWKTLYNHPKVKIIPRVETQEEVYNIMQQVDCGVFPSRGEGWNLELLEMMAVGKHAIATNYSAHTEFCTNENCSLLSIEGLEPAYDGKWFFGQGHWAKIGEKEVEILESLMEDFHVNNKKEHLNTAGIETATNFSWDNSAKKIIGCLENKKTTMSQQAVMSQKVTSNQL